MYIIRYVYTHYKHTHTHTYARNIKADRDCTHKSIVYLLVLIMFTLAV